MNINQIDNDDYHEQVEQVAGTIESHIEALFLHEYADLRLVADALRLLAIQTEELADDMDDESGNA